MKPLILSIVILIPILSFSSTNNVAPHMSFAFRDSTLRKVLSQYGKMTGKRVELVENVNTPPITLIGRKVPCNQVAKLIESELNKQGISLFEIGSDRIVAAYIKPDASTLAAREYLDYCKATKKTPQLKSLFRTNELKECREDNSEIEDLYSQWFDSQKAIDALLMESDEYRFAYEKWKSSKDRERQTIYETYIPIRAARFRHLENNSDIYKGLREKKDEAIFNCNILTLEALINQYEREKKFFPVIGDYKSRTTIKPV